MKARLPYCGFCGKRMREVFVRDLGFDRATGQPNTGGVLYWRCRAWRDNNKPGGPQWHDNECEGRLDYEGQTLDEVQPSV